VIQPFTHFTFHIFFVLSLPAGCCWYGELPYLRENTAGLEESADASAHPLEDNLAQGGEHPMDKNAQLRVLPMKGIQIHEQFMPGEAVNQAVPIFFSKKIPDPAPEDQSFC
jgi:hypothetical protein